jgi:hypothetical protein
MPIRQVYVSPMMTKPVTREPTPPLQPTRQPETETEKVTLRSTLVPLPEPQPTPLPEPPLTPQAVAMVSMLRKAIYDIVGEHIRRLIPMCDRKIVQTLVLEACLKFKDTYPEDNSGFWDNAFLEALWDDCATYPNYHENLRENCKKYSQWSEVEDYYIEILQLLKGLSLTLVVALIQEHAIDCFSQEMEKSGSSKKHVQEHFLPRLKQAGFEMRRIW